MSGKEGGKRNFIIMRIPTYFPCSTSIYLFFCLATTFTFPIYLNDEMNEKPSEQSLAHNQHKDYKYTNK